MKKTLVALLVCICFTTVLARAEDPPDSSLAEGYGILIPIESELDYSGLDRGYLDDPDTKTSPAMPTGRITTPVWYPDGKRIFFTDLQNILWIPVTGGKPHVAFESVYLYPFNGKNYVLYNPISMIVGFSPDGNKLYFIRSVYDSGEIVISFNDQGEWNGVGGNASYLPDLVCLDMNTGSVSTIAKNVFTATLSRSGKYIAYRVNGTLTTVVMNIESNEQWEVPITEWAYFTADDQYLLSPMTSGAGLFRMPIRGGEKEKYKAFPTGSTGLAIGLGSPDLDPGGNWLLYTIWKGASYNNSITRPTGGNYSYNKSVLQLSIFNLQTGKTYDVAPHSKVIDAKYARFSPDGKRFCYIRDNYEGENYQEEKNLYIKDITLPATDGQDTPNAVTGDTPSAFALTGNYPNPFNPTTTISFTLPSSGAATLAVYSVTGQKVRELVSGPLTAGAHSVVWDGRDNSGKAVSSGVYISRLSMGNKTTAGRLLLAK